MEYQDTFRTIAAPSKGIYKEKASKFIGHAYPVDSEETVKEILSALRKEYYDANHHCYAWRIGTRDFADRMNDDGEPSGSAGKPIHGQILSKELTNVLVVVIRYFGGTKLGIPGLVRAYKTTAKETLDAASVVTRTINVTFTLRFDYSFINDVMRIVKEEDVEMISRDFENACRISFSVRKNRSEQLKEKIKSLQGQGKIILENS